MKMGRMSVISTLAKVNLDSNQIAIANAVFHSACVQQLAYLGEKVFTVTGA